MKVVAILWIEYTIKVILFYFVRHPITVGVNHESIKAVAITAKNVKKGARLSSRNT